MPAATGHFNDGRSAKRHPVTLTLEDDALLVADAVGTVLARWPVADIRYADAAHRAAPVRLAVAGADGRLTLDDDGAWLLPACPNLRPRTFASAKSVRLWLVAGALALASVAGIFLILIPAAARWAVSMVPPAAEAALGVATRDQVVGLFERMGTGACRSPEAEKLLARAADELAATMESPFKIDITVIRFAVPNALALPGGHVVILSGLLDKAENGEEVLGVLAHEIAHVVRRDPLHVALKRAGAAALIGLVIGDVTGGVFLSGVASAAVEGGYSREAEHAADVAAVGALNALGVTARPLARFMERMAEGNAIVGAVPEFLSTHPSSDRRADGIRALGQGGNRFFSPYEWDAIRRMCR